MCGKKGRGLREQLIPLARIKRNKKNEKEEEEEGKKKKSKKQLPKYAVPCVCGEDKEGQVFWG